MCLTIMEYFVDICRHVFYNTSIQVVLSIYARNVSVESVKVEFGDSELGSTYNFLEYVYLLVNHVQLSNISFKLNVYIKIPGEDAYNLKCELYAAVRTVLTI